MLSYAVRRLFLIIPVVWGALTLLFLLFFLVPGDPVDLIAGGGGARAVPEQVRANIEARYGLDKPGDHQARSYFDRTLHGDLGESFASRRDVAEIVGETFKASARL